MREIYVQSSEYDRTCKQCRTCSRPSWTDLPEREGPPTFVAVEGDDRLPLRLSREVSARRGLFQTAAPLLRLPALGAEPAAPDDEGPVAACFLLLTCCFLTGDGDGDMGSSTLLSSIRESWVDDISRKRCPGLRCIGVDMMDGRWPRWPGFYGDGRIASHASRAFKKAGLLRSDL